MFEKIPKNSIEVPLMEIISEFESGTRPKGGVGTIKEGIPSIGGEHLAENGKFNFNKIKFVNEKFFNRANKGKIKINDILVVKDGATTGKVSFIDDSFPFEKSMVNEHVFILRVKDDIYPKWLFYFLHSPLGQQQIKHVLHGMYGGINRDFPNKIFVLKPKKIQTQKNISNILDNFEKIQTMRKLTIKYYTELIKSTFIDIFGDPVINTKKWDLEKLPTIANVERGKFSHRPRDDPAFFGGHVPWIQVGDITSADSNYIIKKYEGTLNERGLSVSKIFPKGTIVLSIAASIGEIGILGFDTAFPDSIVGITPYSLPSEFILYQLLLKKYEIDSKSKIGTQKNINLEILGDVNMIAPEPESKEIKKFMEFASKIKKQVEFLSIQESELKSLSESLQISLLKNHEMVKNTEV